MKEFLKKKFILLPIAILFCLVCSFFAALVQTSGFSVKVSKVKVNMDEFYTERYKDATAKPMRMTIGDKKDGMVNAKLAGNLYLPKNVSESNPAPCVILTHGYLNSKEFQEAPAIEMSKRGYVVFAFDQYDHGDSSWDTPAAFNFYVWSVYDAVEYMYSQKYVLKDDNGNGMISVSGHSMGGFSSELAVAFDELNFTTYHVNTFRMIAAVLSVGADFRYDDNYVKAYSSGVYQNTYETYFTRSAGTIAAEYDEFFFDNDSKKNEEGKTVTKKDFVSDSKGYGMLGLTSAGEAAKWYYVDPTTSKSYATPALESTAVETGDAGERIIYQPKGDHPYNTWSPEATKYMIQFYDHAFDYQISRTTFNGAKKALGDFGIKVGKTSQTWWLKEVATGIGLLSLIASLVLGLLCLASLPFFKKAAVAEEDIPVVEETSTVRKVVGLIVTAFSIFLSIYLIVPLMNRSATELDNVVKLTTAVWTVCIFLAIGLTIGFIVLKALGKEFDAKAFEKSALCMAIIVVISIILKYVVTDGITKIASPTNKFWAAPSINTIVYWAFTSGIIGLLFATINYLLISKNRTIAHLGLKVSFKQVAIALLIAILGVCGVFLIIELSLLIFNVDYRVYTYAFNTTTWAQFKVALRYMPLFFVFYLCAGIAIANATAGKKGIKADLIAVAIETLPCALFLLYQYGTLLATGTAPYPTFALNGILVQGLILTLVFLSIIQRRTLEKTNNIWIGVFTNTILFTLITLASTAVYNLG